MSWYSPTIVQLVEITVPPYRVLACAEGLPELYDDYREHAQLVDEIDLEPAGGARCFVAIGSQPGWPLLVVAQRYAPAGSGFHPGILVVPETATVFIGAGERLLAYRLAPRPRRLWTDSASIGFWSWSRYEDVVIMAAELDLAAWTTAGEKLWSTFVEPPWEYSVKDGVVALDVMGRKSSFPLASGPQAAGR